MEIKDALVVLDRIKGLESGQISEPVVLEVRAEEIGILSQALQSLSRVATLRGVEGNISVFSEGDVIFGLNPSKPDHFIGYKSGDGPYSDSVFIVFLDEAISSYGLRRLLFGIELAIFGISKIRNKRGSKKKRSPSSV